MAWPCGKGVAQGAMEETSLPEGIHRLRAGNAGPMTGTGTNTYILGKTAKVVIDPGPDDPAHLEAILSALGPDADVEGIIVTHSHLDHSALAPRLARAVSAPILAFGDAAAGLRPLEDLLWAASLPGGGEGMDYAFAPDESLKDGAVLELAEMQLHVLHTPGHTGNHICLALPDKGVVFSGDHVMGWSTSIVSPPDGFMADYLLSLEKLIRYGEGMYLPGHGDPVPQGKARSEELLAHRRARESAVVKAFSARRGLMEATAQIYADTPPHLHPAAARNVLAHLIDLVHRGEMTVSGSAEAPRFQSR